MNSGAPSKKLGSSCPNRDTYRVNIVKHPVISYKGREEDVTVLPHIQHVGDHL